MIDFPQLAEAFGFRRSILVFVPHPDDETIGCGGLIAKAIEAGITVDVVLVTDGGASHSVTPTLSRTELARMRRAELSAALAILGSSSEPLCLNLYDAETASISPAERHTIARTVASQDRLSRADVVLTTWRREPHCDHQFSYELGREVAGLMRVPLIEYMVWTPVAAEAGSWPQIGETTTFRLDVSDVLQRKRSAIECHRSQLGHLEAPGFDLRPYLEKMIGRYERYEVQRSNCPPPCAF